MATARQEVPQARKRVFLRGTNLLLFGIAAILAIGFFALVVQLRAYNDEADAFRGRVIEFDLGLTNLQSQIGYDGMIHDFKNCVLRPAEPTYCERTRENAAAALQTIDNLEALSADIGAEAEFSSTRMMIAAYAERSADVAQMHGEGAPISEVDAAVRFDDIPAAREISAIQSAAKRVADSVAGQYRRDTMWLSIGILSVLAVLMLAIIGLVRQRVLFVQARSRARTADRLTLANQRLGDANNALQQFASIASHDLKAPVRHMALFADAIRQEAEGREPITELTGDITNAAREMGGIIDSLLTFAKTGFREAECDEVDTRKLLSEAVSLMAVQVAQSGAEISYHQVPDTIYGDAQLLRQAFRNLLANSLKYTSPGVLPEIEISGAREDGFVTFAVTDNGIGIAPEFAEEVFRPLRRLHGAESGFEGSGLGLSLVRAIARAHGGEASIDTDYTGGTRVILTVNEAALCENVDDGD